MIVYQLQPVIARWTSAYSLRWTSAYSLSVLVVLVLALGGAQPAWSQQTGKSKDDALDSLIEDLSKAKEAVSGKAAGRGESSLPAKPGRDRSKPDEQAAPRSRAAAKASERAANDKSGKPAAKKAGSGSVAPKDQELDSLLEKLGEAKDAPPPAERPGGSGGTEPPKEDARPGKPSPPKLGGKDKEIDERLEELTGRRKKRAADDEKRSGPVGEIIKEMRDVEERLGKPDTGGDTQNRQKQIVKRIETLIELVRQSGGSAAGFRVRRVRRPAQQGQQPGDQTGALARGAPPMKPQKPPSQHSTANSKEIWGHLPAELQAVMENSFKEVELPTKADLISRYFLSVAKGRPVREGE
jgi:hypothetical protein